MQHLTIPFSVLSLTAIAGSAVINVPADYTTIQAAVNAASNGDEILVSPGNYAGPIVFADLSITIRATGLAAETIVEGTGTCHVIMCYGNDQNDDVVLEGLTITGGGGEACELDRQGAGLWVGWLRNLTIKDCVFSNNSIFGEDGEGGGLWMAQIYGSALITGCTFSNNTAEDIGGGILCSGSNATITNCTFSNNSSAIGGDIYIYDGATVSNCDFCGNGANSINGQYSGSGNTFLDVCSQTCPDTNADGYVDIADLLAVLHFWYDEDSDADVDEDGLVGMGDLNAIINSWGPCG
jgi:predicted outer membrane repeat protein